MRPFNGKLLLIILIMYKVVLYKTNTTAVCLRDVSNFKETLMPEKHVKFGQVGTNKPCPAYRGVRLERVDCKYILKLRSTLVVGTRFNTHATRVQLSPKPCNI